MSSAVPRFATSVVAAATRACSERFVNFGTTTAASTARITSTSSNSTSVKPRARLSRSKFLRFIVLTPVLPPVLMNQFLQLEKRQQHADDNHADHCGHHKQQ